MRSDRLHSQAGGNRRVLVIAAQVPESVEHVVHTHDRGGRLRGEEGGLAQVAGGCLQNGFGQARVSHGYCRAYRRAPRLLLRQFHLLKHAGGIEFQVLRVVGAGFQYSFQFHMGFDVGIG